MAENNFGEVRDGTSELSDPTSGIEAKRAKLKFKRAAAADTESAFTSTSRESSARKQRPIPNEKRTALTANDSEPVSARKVKGKPPNPPEDETEVKKGVRKRTGKGYKVYPTVDNAHNQATFLLSALEMAAVTTSGPKAEMTEWERAILTGPLQRMIQRTPLSVVEKGGIVFDIGFLTIGGAIYFSRVFKDVQLPRFGKQRTKGTQEDTQAPQAAPAYQTVQTTKAGDVDGLAQPVPVDIQRHMNGMI
jgi:hypothetical protein